ncbi:reverse transcriptase domain-containing protein [Tanacetum coccineum]
MPPRIRTRSAGRPAAESLGGGTGERVGRGGRGRRPREGNDERVDDLNGQGNDQGMGANGGNLLPAMLAQVSNRGNVRNQNGNVVNENVWNVIVNGNRVGCSYKEFLACNPKEYDGKGGDVVLTHWIKKMESVHDMSGCSIDQKVKYTAGSFVGKALTWWNSQIRTLSREVAVSMSWNDFKFMMIQEFCPSHEMQKLESELWNHAMVKAGHAAYTDSERVVEVEGRRLGKVQLPRNVYENQNGKLVESELWNHAMVKAGHAAYTDRFHELARTARENRPNQVATNNGGQGRGNQRNQARGRAFMLGAEEARQDLDIVTGLEPNELGFRYEIEIASGQLVKIDKVIKGMDWLSNYKAEIICHEKVVRIPLSDGKVLRVLGDSLEEKARLLMSAKANKRKQEEIVVVRDFLEVFPDDLSRLPPIREIEFQIELIPGATPVAKSPYHLAPSELEELSGQLKELQDKGFIRPSSSPWGAPKIWTFNGDEEQELHFNLERIIICNAPVLALPDGPKDFVLKIHEENDTTLDLELGAVVLALKIWRHYLYGTKSVIYTDHKSLQHIFSKKELNMRQRRWIELFSDYDCEICYHPGKEKCGG